MAGSLDPALASNDQVSQNGLLVTYSESLYTNLILDTDSYRVPLPSQSSAYELIQIHPASAQAGITNLFRFDELQTKVQQAAMDLMT